MVLEVIIHVCEIAFVSLFQQLAEVLAVYDVDDGVAGLLHIHGALAIAVEVLPVDLVADRGQRTLQLLNLQVQLVQGVSGQFLFLDVDAVVQSGDLRAQLLLLRQGHVDVRPQALHLDLQTVGFGSQGVCLVPQSPYLGFELVDLLLSLFNPMVVLGDLCEAALDGGFEIGLVLLNGGQLPL